MHPIVSVRRIVSGEILSYFVGRGTVAAAPPPAVQ